MKSVAESQFSGDPVATWLTDSNRPDRNMQLLEPFSFRDPSGKVWAAPSGSIVDGASIPRALWSIVGSPYTGNYRRASIVHDVACDNAGEDFAQRLAADKMFFHACRRGGCTVAQSIILYVGVRIGAAAKSRPLWRMASFVDEQGPRLVRTLAEERLERDFREIAEGVLAEGETDDIDLVETRFQRMVSLVAVVPGVSEIESFTGITAERESLEEARKWRVLEPICADALRFWNDFLHFRSGTDANGPRLTTAHLDRLTRISRAVSWVESRHGTGTGAFPDKDPMQCGNPADAWWRELLGPAGTGSRLVGGADAANYFASDLPAVAEKAPGFPAEAALSRLTNPGRGHRDPGFSPRTSFVWGVVYLIHRCNTSPNVRSGRTFACGDLARSRLIGGAVNYNGGGVADYQARVDAALRLFGDIT